MQFKKQPPVLKTEITGPSSELQDSPHLVTEITDEHLCNPVIPSKKTFDGRIVEDIKVPSSIRHLNKSQDANKYSGEFPFYPHKFDFNSYEFYDNENAVWKNKEYKKQFIISKNNEVNKKKIFQQLVQLVYVQATKAMSEHSLPQVFQDNHQNFCKMLVRSPKLQQFYSQFSDSFQKIMRDELLNNQENFKLFVSHPHSFQNQSFYPNLAQAPNDDYICQAMDDAHRKFNYKKEKAARMKIHIYGKPRHNHAQTKKEMEKAMIDAKFERKNRSQDPKENRKKEKVYSNFQIMLKERTEAIQSLVDSIDDNNEELINEVENCEYFLDELDQELRDKKCPVVPGLKINELMTKWGQDIKSVQSPAQLDKYSHELWMSLAQYEEHMKSEIKGHEYILRKTHKQYKNQIEFIQQNASFHIQALESALIEVKLKANREREGLEMELADIQSKNIHKYSNVEKLDAIVQQCDEKLILRNVQEARSIIKKLVSIIKGNRDTIHNYEEQIKSGNGSIEQTMEMIKDMKQQKTDSDALRLFYMKLTMKLSRDLELFADEKEENVMAFMNINEDEDNIEQQKSFRETLEKELNIRQVFVDHANRVFGFKQGLSKVKNQADSLLNKLDQQVMSPRSDQSEKKAPTSRQSSMKSVLSPQRKLSKTFSTIAKAQFMNLIERAMEGVLDTPVVTLETGQPMKQDQTLSDMKSHRNKKKKEQVKKEQFKKKDKVAPKVIKSPAAAEKVTVKQQEYIRIKNSPRQSPQQSTQQSKSRDPTPDTKREKSVRIVIEKPKPKSKHKPKSKKLETKNSFDDSQLSSVQSKNSISNSDDDEIGSINSAQKNLNLMGQRSSSANQLKVIMNVPQRQKQRKVSRQASLLSDVKNPKDIVIREPSQFSQSHSAQEEKQTVKIKEIKTKAKSKAVSKNDESPEPKNKKSSTSPDKKKKKSDASPDSKRKQPTVTLKLPVVKRNDSDKSLASNLSKTSKVSKVSKVSKATKISKISKKSEKKKQNLKVKINGNDKEQDQEPQTEVLTPLIEITGLCRIEKELENLYSSKYTKMKQQVEEEIEEDPTTFKINAQQIQAMQEFVQTCINEKLPYNEYSTMFTGDIQSLVAAFQVISDTHYGFKSIRDFISSQGQVSSPPLNSKIKFGDLLKPMINEQGEFIGLSIRDDLIKPLYLESDLELTQIKRAIKICTYVNRMIKDGKVDDFQLKQIKGGEAVKIKEKEFATAEVQVDEEELKNNIPTQSSEESSEEKYESEHDGDINWQVKTLLKNHAIDIMTRLNPTKRGYYKLVWEEMTLEKLFEYKLENVFKTREKEQKSTIDPGMPFGKYLEFMFSTLQKKLHEMGLTESQMERFVIEEFINTGIDQAEKSISEVSSERCKKIQAQPKVTDNYCLTGPELMPPPIIKKTETKAQKMGTNQLILDKALEQEFQRTFELFDTYVDIQTKNNRTIQQQKRKTDDIFSEADSIKGSKYHNIKIGDILINKQSQKQDDLPDINLEQDLSQMRGRLQMAIDDMKMESDIMFSPHLYDRNSINNTLIPSINDHKKTQFNSLEHSHSQSSHQKVKNAQNFRQNMTAHHPERKINNNLKGNALKVVKKAAHEIFSNIDNPTPRANNGSMAEINSTHYTGSYNKANRSIQYPVNLRKSVDSRKKKQSPSSRNKLKDDIMSIRKEPLNKSTMPKIMENNQKNKLIISELQKEMIKQSRNKKDDKYNSQVIEPGSMGTNNSIPSDIMGKLQTANVKWPNTTKKSLMGTISVQNPDQNHYRSIQNQPHSFLTIGKQKIRHMDFQSQQFLVGQNNKTYTIEEDSGDTETMIKLMNSPGTMQPMFHTTMPSVNTSPLRDKKKKIVFSPHMIKYN